VWNKTYFKQLLRTFYISNYYDSVPGIVIVLVIVLQLLFMYY